MNHRVIAVRASPHSLRPPIEFRNITRHSRTARVSFSDAAGPTVSRTIPLARHTQANAEQLSYTFRMSSHAPGNIVQSHDITVDTACPLDCPDACSLAVKVNGGRVVEIDGSLNQP